MNDPQNAIYGDKVLMLVESLLHRLYIQGRHDYVQIKVKSFAIIF